MKGASNGAEAQSTESKQILGQPDLPSEGEAQALLVDRHQPSFVLEEAVLPFTKHGDEPRVVAREADDRPGKRLDAICLARASRRGHGVSDHLQHLLEDPSKERLLAVEIPVENAVGKPGSPTDGGDRHGSVPLMREQLNC